MAALLLLLAVLAAVTGWRGRAGTLRRSGRLGVHTEASELTDNAFALANRVAAPILLAAAAVFGLGGVLVLALRLPTAATLVVFAVALVGGMLLLRSAAALGQRAAASLPRPLTKQDRPAGCDGCACGAGGCAVKALKQGAN
ncbi:hypothetical protein HKD39_13960 [Nakamurella sp. DB0629]|uniref:SdpI/YhfL family protein n=1 Tax=Nakamurella aerolata TaxID=1656892 RepID=A0A849ACC7_9ACTN|nr:hypothetical protein [Nakamurella aerolata]